MSDARISSGIAEDWSCAADFLDDIEVDANGMCRWSEVANAQTHIRHSLRSVQPRTVAQALSEQQRHAIEHARWQVEHATPDDPECSFDYELVKVLVEMLDRAYPVSSTDRVVPPADRGGAT